VDYNASAQAEADIAIVPPPTATISALDASNNPITTMTIGQSAKIQATFTPAANDTLTSASIDCPVGTSPVSGASSALTYNPWTPGAAGTYVFYACAATNSYPKTVSYASTTVLVNAAAMVAPTSANATIAVGTAWAPTVTDDTGSGTGANYYKIGSGGAWTLVPVTASWTPAVGTYTFYVGQASDGSHTGNTSVASISATANNFETASDAAHTYTLTVVANAPTQVTINATAQPKTGYRAWFSPSGTANKTIIK
jgi:hypothetical protein